MKEHRKPKQLRKEENKIEQQPVRKEPYKPELPGKNDAGHYGINKNR